MLGAKVLDEIEDQVSLESKEEGGIKNWKPVSIIGGFQLCKFPFVKVSIFEVSK